MKEETTHKQTFILRILNTQHASWQGTVTWTDEDRTESFRSALELISLISSTIDEAEKEPAEPQEDQPPR